MKTYLTALLVLFGLFCTSIHLSAQDSINAGSGDVTDVDISICYSIGQTFFDHLSYTEGTTTMGIQQAYDVSLLTSLSEIENDALQLYPNPAVNFVELSFPEYNKFDHQMILFDSSGRAVYRNEIKEPVTEIDVQSLEAGIYFLQVINKEESVKVFKLIKK